MWGVLLSRRVSFVLLRMLSRAWFLCRRNTSIYQFVEEYNPCIYNQRSIPKHKSDKRVGQKPQGNTTTAGKTVKQKGQGMGKGKEREEGKVRDLAGELRAIPTLIDSCQSQRIEGFTSRRCFQKLSFGVRLNRFHLLTDFARKTTVISTRNPPQNDRSDRVEREVKGRGWVRFGEVVEKPGICGLEGVVFGKVCGDIDVWLMRIKHVEMVM